MFKNGNWGLKILSLVLAIVIYYALKRESVQSEAPRNDRTIFKRP